MISFEYTKQLAGLMLPFEHSSLQYLNKTVQERAFVRHRPLRVYLSSLQMVKPSTPLFWRTVSLGTRLRAWQPANTQCNYITMVSQSNYNACHSGPSPCWYTMLTTPGTNLCTGVLSTGDNVTHYGGSHGTSFRILLEANCLYQWPGFPVTRWYAACHYRGFIRQIVVTIVTKKTPESH